MKRDTAYTRSCCKCLHVCHGHHTPILINLFGIRTEGVVAFQRNLEFVEFQARF